MARGFRQARRATESAILGDRTAAAWLSALQSSHQIVLLEAWFASRTKTLVKRPKLYLRDAGLAAFLCGVHSIPALHSSPLAGCAPAGHGAACGYAGRSLA